MRLLLILLLVAIAYGQDDFYPCPENQVLDTVINKRGKKVLFDGGTIPHDVCKSTKLNVHDTLQYASRDYVVRYWHKGRELFKDSTALCEEAKNKVEATVDVLGPDGIRLITLMAKIPSCINGEWLEDRKPYVRYLKSLEMKK